MESSATGGGSSPGERAVTDGGQSGRPVMPWVTILLISRIIRA
jgi:hypothetical protein